MRRLVTSLIVLTLFACSDRPQARAPLLEALPQDPKGNFGLFISNQSFEHKHVDIRVDLDGKLAVAQEFDVGDQHTWVEFTYGLDPGKHLLSVTSVEGGASLQREFETGARNWVVLSFWCCDRSAGEPKFSFQLTDEAPGFD